MIKAIKASMLKLNKRSRKQVFLGLVLPLFTLAANIAMLSVMWHSILFNGLEFSASQVGWFATIMVLLGNILHCGYAYVFFIHNKGD